MSGEPRFVITSDSKGIKTNDRLVLMPFRILFLRLAARIEIFYMDIE